MTTSLPSTSRSVTPSHGRGGVEGRPAHRGHLRVGGELVGERVHPPAQLVEGGSVLVDAGQHLGQRPGRFPDGPGGVLVGLDQGGELAAGAGLVGGQFGEPALHTLQPWPTPRPRSR